jgi:TRAP-type C4-dicarboxylate transport system substrate-binding protein
LPFLQPAGGHSAKKDIHRLLAPLYQPLYEKWGVFELAVSYNPPQNYWHVSKFLENMDSMKGEKIRTFGVELDDFVKMMGGIPVRVDAAEAYTALQTGIISGLITGVPFAVNTKLVEVVKRFQPLEVFYPTHLVLVNKNAWSKLPPEVRGAVQQYFDTVSGYFADSDVMAEAPKLQEAVDKYGVQVKPMPPGLRDQIIGRAYEGIWKPWASRSGAGTMEFLDLVVKKILEAGYKIPGYPSN